MSALCKESNSRKPSRASPNISAPKSRDDPCLLHVDRAALPSPGETGTASLEDLRGADSPLLAEEILVRNVKPPLSVLRAIRSHPSANPGHWNSIVRTLDAALMCGFLAFGQAHDKSVFGVMKTDFPKGAHRLTFTGNKTI